MNKLFLYFLLVIGIDFLFNSDFIFIGILTLAFSFFHIVKLSKNNNQLKITALIIIFVCVIRFIVPSMIFLSQKEIIGLVIKKSNNYIIVFNGINKTYIDTKDASIDFLDIVKFTGKFSDYNFHPLESSFDFGKYLSNYGVKKQFNCNSYRCLIDFPINIHYLKLNYLSLFVDENVKSFIGGILFNSTSYDNNKINELKFLNYTVLLSVTGVYLNYFIYKISSLLSCFFKNKTSDLCAFILISPLLFLNIDKFTTYKVALFFLIRFVNRYYLKDLLSKIERISIVGLFFILIDPFIAFQESFILSFLISIFMNFSYLFKRRFKRIKLWLINLTIITLLLLPFNINASNSLNILRILSNLLISYAIRPLFIVFYFTIFVFGAKFLDGFINFLINFLIKCDFNILNINVPKISASFIFVYYVLLGMFFYFYEVNFKKMANKVFVFMALSISIYAIPISNLFTFEISYINIGQGDSTLIRYKEKMVLIDTGGLLYTDVAINSLVPYFRSKRIYRIDDLILTHDDYDHSGALNSLIEHYPVKKVYRKKESFPIKIYNDFIIENLNNFNVSKEDNNYKSLVLNFKIKNVNFLIMGDAPIEIENDIMIKFPLLKCDILKVGHHGSNTSSSESFIKFLLPKIAVISCGYKNKFHHPNDSVIKILNKYDVIIRRTDLEGTINYKFWL